MTTAAIIILSAFLGGSICVNIAASASKKRMSKRISNLKARIAEYDEDRLTANARYYYLQHVSGFCTVYRMVAGSNTPGVLIKKFDTEDAEYNRNEAVELIDNLEKTLCYD